MSHSLRGLAMIMYYSEGRSVPRHAKYMPANCKRMQLRLGYALFSWRQTVTWLVSIRGASGPGKMDR